MSHCLCRGFERFRTNAFAGANADAIGDLQGAVAEIGTLKQKCVDIEEENNEISEQNEALKEGAKEGVNNLAALTEVQEEIEGVNDELVEQAEQLKQLLMKNKQLKAEMEDYE